MYSAVRQHYIKKHPFVQCSECLKPACNFSYYELLGLNILVVHLLNRLADTSKEFSTKVSHMPQKQKN